MTRNPSRNREAGGLVDWHRAKPEDQQDLKSKPTAEAMRRLCRRRRPQIPPVVERSAERDEARQSEYFFYSRTGGRKLTYRNSYRDLKNVCRKIGIEGEHVHPHSFRHYFAVSYIRNGGDIYRLSRILGHTSISTTQLYLRSMGVEHLLEGHSQFSPLAKLT